MHVIRHLASNIFSQVVRITGNIRCGTKRCCDGNKVFFITIWWTNTSILPKIWKKLLNIKMTLILIPVFRPVSTCLEERLENRQQRKYRLYPGHIIKVNKRVTWLMMMMMMVVVLVVVIGISSDKLSKSFTKRPGHGYEKKKKIQRVTECLLIATWNDSIKTKYIQAKIENMQQNSRGILCG